MQVKILVLLHPKCSWDEGAAAQAWGCSPNLSLSPAVPALANPALLLSTCRAVRKERICESAQRKKGSVLGLGFFFSEVWVVLGGFSC